MNATSAIRSATVADAAEIARLSAQLDYPADEQVFAARLRRLLDSPVHAVLVAADADGPLAGFIALEQRITLELGERVEIVGLVVDGEVRRSGVGRSLVATAERWTRDHGLAEVFLRSNIVRPEAHPFYERLGYLRAKTQHAYRKRLA